jgi:Flp pilus assembly protein TadD
LATKGEALTALGRPDEAAIAFSQVLTTDPASVSAQIGLGRIKLATDPVAAEALFLGALSHEPRNGVALNDLGIARDLQGRHTDAQSAYRGALGIDPDMRAAQINLALSLAMSGQSKDAVQLLRPLANKPDASQQLRHDMAAVLAMTGDKTEAEQILGKDLPPDQVKQAMDAFASAASQPNAAATLLAGAPAPEAEAAPPRATSRSPVGAPSIAPLTSVAAAQLGSTTPPVVDSSEKAAATAEHGNDGVEVQLAGPTPSRNAAQIKWGRLQRQMPDEFAGHAPIFAEVHVSGRTVWRVRTGGFMDIDKAGAFCEHVRANGASCALIQ